MKKFKYDVKTLQNNSFEELIEIFNQLGNDGWEIINIEHNYDDPNKYRYIVWSKKELM